MSNPHFGRSLNLSGVQEGRRGAGSFLLTFLACSLVPCSSSQPTRADSAAGLLAAVAGTDSTPAGRSLPPIPGSWEHSFADLLLRFPSEMHMGHQVLLSMKQLHPKLQDNVLFGDLAPN